MQTLTRRRLIKLAATTSAGTTATALLGDTSRQSVSPTRASSKSGGFSPDLCAYATNGILTTVAKLHNHTATQEDVQAAASHTRLVANHLHDCGIDTFFSQNLPAAQATTVRGNQLPDIDTYRKVMAQFVPDFDPAQAFPTMSASQNDVQSAYDQVRKVGLSGMFHAHADKLQRFSASLAPKASSASAAPVSWNEGTYFPDLHPAHFAITQSCGGINSAGSATTVIQEVCAGAGFAAIYLSTALAYVLAACENNPEAFVYCSSLAAEVAALGLTLSAGTWVGLTLAAIAVLLYFFC